MRREDAKSRFWTKKQIEDYCAKLIGPDQIIRMVSYEDNDTAAARTYCSQKNDPDEPDEIHFASRKFPVIVIFHECGHLITQWTKPSCTESEVQAHKYAILLALNRGNIQIAKDLIEELEEWGRKMIYTRAKNILLKKLKEFC